MKIVGAVLGAGAIFFVCWRISCGPANRSNALCAFCAMGSNTSGGLSALAIGAVGGWLLGGMLEK
jgi:hypothetical protein